MKSTNCVANRISRLIMPQATRKQKVQLHLLKLLSDFGCFTSWEHADEEDLLPFIVRDRTFIVLHSKSSLFEASRNHVPL